MSTSYSIGEMNQLAGALEKAEFTSDDITKLREFGRLADFRRVLRGDLELVEKRVSDIHLGRAYQLMGMLEQYQEVQQRFDFAEDPILWKLVMLKGVTYTKLVDAYKEAGINLETFGVNLQEAIDPSREQRDPNRDGDYLVCFHRNVEADEENANQSANQRKDYKDNTLAERLLLGLVYFLATGEHLDDENITLCAGSRNRGGDVPRVSWDADNGRVQVSWCGPGFRYVSLCTRSVVSLAA